ncbi:ankyrin repeat domain-containing protein [Wolbachia endosymbiont of Cimex lectularius]|uniref:ankyrin repeat domain-containing protein n=1 Tax=Wolbachia endosymbiont of Cimex lectularius TaxID=246273 RepID=UPI00049A8589|nr:ankyrin repeat domain-containing protein [Wolbachia endosymbiont of Cimex lectularius]BAO99442.1 ankyrin repeat-containing protein [Wolbachia endosymbiont of Cimex lectularius]
MEKRADVSIKDANGNNALHLITKLRKKQKLEFLNAILNISKWKGKELLKEQFIKAVNDKNDKSGDSKNSSGQTPIQKLLFNKITKGEHSSESVSGKIGKFLKRPFTEYDDHTIEAAIKLFELGANINDLQLSKEELQNLDREHERYYLKFLEKLAESIKKPELKQEIKTQIKEIIVHTINTPDSNGNYLLHSAINNYDKELFKELLQKGANVSLKDANGDNALHRIALLKKKHKITYLKSILDLKEEGTVPSKTLCEAVNAKNNDNRYPAQVALVRQIEKIPSKLKDFSKWVRPRPTKHYYTAEFCAMLLQNGAENKSDHITIEKYDNKKYYHTKERIQELTGVSPNREVDEALNQRFSKNKKRGNNIDLPVRWILGGLIFATVFSALAGNMIVAAALSVTIAVCAMCYPAYLKLENFLNDRNSETQKPSDQSKHTESPPSPKVDNVLIQVLKDCQEFNKQINTPSSQER